jgi:hypothetical protein
MPRRAVPGLVEVTDTMTGAVVGHVGNVSVGGMLLIAQAPLVEEGLYQFAFTLPDERRPLEVGAHVLWLDAAGAPGQAWAGVRFLGLAPESTRQLREWIGHGNVDA